MANPTIVVADEPTGSLDDDTTEQILTLLQRVNQELGMTLLMVTHDADAAMRATRQVRLERGKLVENGRAITPRIEDRLNVFNFVPIRFEEPLAASHSQFVDDQRGGSRATSVLLRWLRTARAVRADRE